MYNEVEINKLISLIQRYDGIGDKEKLSRIVQGEFGLIKDRRVFSDATADFAIRFSMSKRKKMGNTVLSLSALQKYDSRPFFVCIVTSTKNYLLLANTTFLKKISHSSKKLRIDNIKGSFNGSDIILDFHGIENTPQNFQALYAYHEGLSFQDNLERLVENTNGIVGRVQKYQVTKLSKITIFDSIKRAISFIKSSHYIDLRDDLDKRVAKVQREIAIAAFIDNVNIRGRIIEYLITESSSTLKNQIIAALRNKTPLPQFKTQNKLGDYSKNYPDFKTETDIKTKIMFLNGNPKAYNVDKFLEFLANDKSVYMIYLVGIGINGELITRLCSVFAERLMGATRLIHQWAGRNSRGVAQFLGDGLVRILEEGDSNEISQKKAHDFVENLIRM